MTTVNSAGHLAELVIAQEVTKGTSPAITTGLRDYFPEDPGINPVQTMIPLDNIQPRYRMGHVHGKYFIEGNIPQIVTPGGHIGYWLSGAIGSPTSAQQGGTAAYKHTYSPANDVPTFSAWFARGGNQQVVIPYSVVNSLKLVQDENVLRSQVNIIGQKDTINADDITTADAYDTATPFHNTNLTVTGPTNAANAFNTKIEINNNFDVKDGFVHGSRFYTALVPGKRLVSGSFEIWFDDDADYESFWGAATSPIASGAYTPIPLNFKWDTEIEAASGYNYVVELDIPEVEYLATSVKIDKRIHQQVTWAAQYNAVAGYDIEAYLINKVVSYP